MREAGTHQEPLVNGLQEVATDTEKILNRSMYREKGLRLHSGFEARQLTLALPCRLVGAASATDQPLVVPVSRSVGGRSPRHPDRGRPTSVAGPGHHQVPSATAPSAGCPEWGCGFSRFFNGPGAAVAYVGRSRGCPRGQRSQKTRNPGNPPLSHPRLAVV